MYVHLRISKLDSNGGQLNQKNLQVTLWASITGTLHLLGCQENRKNLTSNNALIMGPLAQYILVDFIHYF